MNRRRRAILGLALGLPLALILVLASAAFWWLQAEPGQRWLVGLWREQAAARLGAELEVGSLEGNPLWEMRVKNLRLTRQGRPLFAVDQVELSHNPLALLGGRLQLGKLILHHPLLDLPADSPPSPPDRPASTTPPLRLTIEGLRIVQGGLRLGGPSLEEVSGLDVVGRLSLDALGLRGNLELSRGLARVKGMSQPVVLSAVARLHKDGLAVSSLALEMGEARLEAKGDLAWARETDLKASVRLSMPAKGAASPAWWPLKEALQATLDLSGPLDGLALRADISGQDLGLHLKGKADFATFALELTGGLVSGDMQALGLTDFPLALGGNLALEARGLPGQPESTASLRLDLDQANSGEMVAGQGHLQAAWRHGALEVSGLELGGDWGSLRGGGRLNVAAGTEASRLDAHLEWRDLTAPAPLAALLPAPLRAAKLTGRLSAQGAWDNLSISLDLGPSSLMPGLQLTSLGARGGRGKGGWFLESLALQSDEASLNVQGRADAQGAALDLALQATSLDRLADLLTGLGLEPPRPLQGSLEAKGRIQGPWEQPALTLEAQARGVSAPGLSCPQATLSWESPRLALPPNGRLSFVAHQLSIQGWRWPKLSLEGSLTPQAGRLELQAQGSHLRLSALASSTGAAWPLEVRLESFSAAWGQEQPWVLPAPASLSMGREGVALRGLVLARRGESLGMGGQVDAQGGVTAELSLSGVRPAAWLALPPPLEAMRLSGQVHLMGSLAAPQASGEILLDGLAWPGLPPSQLRLKGDLQGGILRLRGEVADLERRFLLVEGGVGLDASLSPLRLAVRPQGLDLTLKADDLPLALIEPVTPFLSGLKGRADLELTLSGSPAQPRLEGRGSLAGGRFTIVPTGQTVSDVELGLRLEGKRLVLEKASARSGGTLKITGEATLPWDDAGRCAMKINAEGIKIGLGSIGEVITDADLSVDGSALNPLLTGRARPRQARILPRLASPSAMAEVVMLRRGQAPPPLRREKRKAPRILLPGPLAPLRMDTVVDLGKGLRVAVDEGWLELAGETLVRKEPDGPLTFHKGFSILRGVILAAGKAFEVLPGETDFADKDRPDPDLKATATLRTGTTQIFVNLDGSAFESKLNFSSEPPLSQADILSTIIFGRPARTLSAGESQQLSAQALALLGQRGKAEMERLLGRTLAPDVVAVHNEMQTGPSLEAGKYLSPNLYLRYRQNTGPEGGQNVGLELKLKPYLSLESQVGSTRDNGADVIFSFDFD